MSSDRLRRLGATLALVSICATACSSGSEGEGTETAGDAAPDTDIVASDSDGGEAGGVEVEPIVIGAIMAATGVMAPIDEPALLAAQIEVDRINADGGVGGREVVIRHVDSKSQLNATFAAANELVEGGADMLLLTCDVDFAQPAIEVAAASDVLAMTPCSGSPRWAVDGGVAPTVFSLGARAADEGRALAALADEAAASRVALWRDRSSADGQAQCDGFIEASADDRRIVLDVEVDLSILVTFDEEIAPMLAELSSPPDLIVLCSGPVVGAPTIDVLRAAGLRAPIISGSTMDGSAWLADVEALGPFAMLSYASVFGDDPDPAVQDLVAGYEERAGEAPDTGAMVTGADTVAAYAAAVERANTLDGLRLAAEVEDFVDQPLVTTEVTFSAESHIPVNRALRVLEVIDGEPRFSRIVDLQ